MFCRYRFEADIYPTLSRIPLHVRMKLDLTGVRISLKDWLAFTMEERTVLCHVPVETDEERWAFASYLNSLSQKYRGEPAAAVPALSSSLWDTPGQVPGAVVERCAENGLAVTLAEWQRWNFYQRYAMYKTAVSKSEPEQFFSVLAELREGNRGG